MLEEKAFLTCLIWNKINISYKNLYYYINNDYFNYKFGNNKIYFNIGNYDKNSGHEFYILSIG